MRKQLEDETRRENAKQTEAENLKEEFEHLKALNMQYYNEASGFTSIFEKVETLKARKAMFESNRSHILEGMSEMKGESLSLS